ncbi:MAG: aconitate hydratase AcnA [Anaerolineaceae bacterium]|nr:aconitate hydratase AcnA [Anaerolineaceae bacterium]
MTTIDHLNTRDTLKTSLGTVSFYRLDRLEAAGLGQIDRLPFSVRVLLENTLRNYAAQGASQADVANLAAWKAQDSARPAMPFYPGRVVLQDFSGIPLINDLAAMRSALHRLGGDPGRINPLVPVDLVIDHSVQVDHFGTSDAFRRNAEIEFERNRERYEFVHWGQNAFKNFRVVPPSTGIIHQVNLEYLSQVVLTRQEDGQVIALPDTVVGTDSHTTMVNGLGVVGWGVGGIEAVAAMLNQPIDMLIPDVIGFKLTGQLPEGATPTDLTLTITQMLRKRGVVEKFVEFFGPGVSHMSLADRAMISNMSPENGATVTYFPVDAQSLLYLRQTGRSPEQVELVEAYLKEQHLFRTDQTPEPEFTDVLELDISTVEPSIAGPRRPQDRLPLRQVKTAFEKTLSAPKTEGGFAVAPAELERSVPVWMDGQQDELKHGSIVLAAITSCTNTSNPFVMLGAGLLARNAVEKGLQVRPSVKTSMAPGSRAVIEYLQKADLIEPLDKLGFNLVGFGCTTCIGNSGPLPESVVAAIHGADLVAAAVLSGNRNFEGRINPDTRVNYLASPPLVVAYALAGTVDIDFEHDPIGTGRDGNPVYLRDIWPTSHEIMATVAEYVRPEMFRDSYGSVFTGNPTWNAIHSGSSELYHWDPNSTYLQEPPFFEGLSTQPPQVTDIHGARVLALLGDSVTTDHISPAGAIPLDSPAGRYLTEHGVQVSEFNSFGSRRGNDRVMTRGTFGNIRLKNQLVPGKEGNYTRYLPDGEVMSIYDAAMRYKANGVPLVVIAGKEYGTGSSRDWAAKGAMLLGVRAIIAQSYERIHRSNLVGMGVLPLQFLPGQSAQGFGLTGAETYTISGLSGKMHPGMHVVVRALRPDGQEIVFQTLSRLDTQNEIAYYRNGGILNTVLYNLLKS